ncbi:methionyl-tRNA formyltransferase [Gracilinema caldarium]|uniref:Methionyl-tRNA formyltransferase n=1 Tax=Gracilinema caldarium (strain ATCC 51460 / DSM 7334 / H1) TaxID=744872 RepID=F8F3S5_GRAC1|nr:methionyl-tRNA formyltransferase [Gracilinema caldarium]AEJ20444.1 Methionyl-tRNA formyltransferase [Gracilinema caldarium DSM 7334]
MRIVFAGSPEIAVPSLEALIAEQIASGEIKVVGVLTNPDSRKGRKGPLEPTEVGAAATRLQDMLREKSLQSFLILKPEKLDASVRDQIANLKPDILVSFAYGKIFGPKFLSLFPKGGINIHPSLLPKYRGATPIPAAILNRDRETGITIQTLALQMDSGDILIQDHIELSGRETTESLSRWAAQRGAELLPPVLRGIAEGTIQSTPQDEAKATYCSIISKEDGWISWSASALEIDAKIRAYTPWPLCATKHAGQVLYILEAFPLCNPDTCTTRFFSKQEPPGTVLGIDKKAGILIQTGKGLLVVQRLQYATKKALDWVNFLNGAKQFIGSKLE